MKSYRILTLILAAILITSCLFPAPAASAETLSETPKDAPNAFSEKPDDWSEDASGQDQDSVSGNDCDVTTDENSTQETEPISDPDADASSDEITMQEDISLPEEESSVLLEEDSMTEADSVREEEPVALSNIQIPDEKPPFSAAIEYNSDGYVVKGHFTDFLPDTVFVQPQSSLDGVSWQDCGVNWNLSSLKKEDSTSLHALQNQICLYNRFEPLKSYLAGKLDRFYLRLSITLETGSTYETQAAHIERGISLPVPEEITFAANFTSAILSREADSSGSLTYCGKYQLTISESSSSEDITALLPDTLPVQIDLTKGRQLWASCTIDCPVTWKTLSLSGLTAGGQITIRDAAEEILVPAGTQLSTPMGTFKLPEHLGIEQNPLMSDEVILVLNVIPEGAAPTGVLSARDSALEMAFDLKPSGATAIRAYILSEGDSQWTHLPELPLLHAVDAQPSTANSGYTTILRGDQEPYHSYLHAISAQEEAASFLVGLQIEGGVYNGCQLILPWPSTYDFPPDLRVNGSGGNQGNAGIGNRDDSTEEGQRPNLPQNTADETTKQQSDSLEAETNDSENPTDPDNHVPPNVTEIMADTMKDTKTLSSKLPQNITESMQADASGLPADAIGTEQASQPRRQAGGSAAQQTGTAQTPEGNQAITANPDTASNAISGQEGQQSPNAAPGQSPAGASAAAQAITDNPEKSGRIPLLPLSAAVIAGGFAVIAAAKIITGSITGRPIKKP